MWLSEKFQRKQECSYLVAGKSLELKRRQPMWSENNVVWIQANKHISNREKYLCQYISAHRLKKKKWINIHPRSKTQGLAFYFAGITRNAKWPPFLFPHYDHWPGIKWNPWPGMYWARPHSNSNLPFLFRYIGWQRQLRSPTWVNSVGENKTYKSHTRPPYSMKQ